MQTCKHVQKCIKTLGLNAKQKCPVFIDILNDENGISLMLKIKIITTALSHLPV